MPTSSESMIAIRAKLREAILTTPRHVGNLGITTLLGMMVRERRTKQWPCMNKRLFRHYVSGNGNTTAVIFGTLGLWYMRIYRESMLSALN